MCCEEQELFYFTMFYYFTAERDRHGWQYQEQQGNQTERWDDSRPARVARITSWGQPRSGVWNLQGGFVMSKLTKWYCQNCPIVPSNQLAGSPPVESSSWHLDCQIWWISPPTRLDSQTTRNTLDGWSYYPLLWELKFGKCTQHFSLIANLWRCFNFI